MEIVNNQNQCVPYNCLNNPENEILDIERSNSTVATNIALEISRLLASATPIGGILLGLFDAIWGSIGPSQWDLFLEQIELLIDQKIEEFARNQAISRLEGISSLYGIYTEAFREWEADPTNPALKEEMRTQFNDMNSILVTAIPLFSVQNYQVPFLSVYVQAANLHLSVLRDVSVFGQAWGFDIATINSRYNDLTRLIPIYTDYAVRWYNTGLDRLPRTGGLRNWARFNQFRRELTISVLDIISFFRNYDSRLYPIPTSSQLTREVYTDPVINITDYRVGPSFENIENSAIRSPHLMDFLNNLTIDTDLIRGVHYWAGHRVTSHFTGSSQVITTPQYGNSQNAEPRRTIAPSTFPGLNLFYRTLSNPFFRRSENITPTLGINVVQGVGFIQPNNAEVLYRSRGTVDSLNELPIDGENSLVGYSHRLSHVTLTRSLYNTNITSLPTFVWTHHSATNTNTINPDIITQIPLVKGFRLGGGTSVIKGPGFTGGDILRRNTIGEFVSLQVNINSPITQRYRLRFRYASSRDARITVAIGGQIRVDMTLEKTMEIGESLTSRTFSYTNFSNPFSFRANPDIIRIAEELPIRGGELYIDKIELILADATFEEEYDLERAQKAVNALFTSTNQLGLKTDVTDYHIDQVSNLVECLSDEFCLDEKRELSEKVKHAKRLSDERNLLQDPNFRGINRQPDRGWRGSTDITIQGGDDVFKENYVTLPGTFDECYPTYLYQKIDESKLKAYTRYELRGYIEDSQDLEIYLIRYNAKHETVNVPGTGSLWPLSAQSPIGKCGEPNRCAPHLEWNPNLDCSCRDGEKCAHHSHHFSLDIDVGCTDLNEDLGVWVIFKIKTQDGYARLGNLEFLEEKPLLGEALARVKRAEKKWRDKCEKLEWETNIVYKEAKESVDALFVNSQYDRLQADTNIAMIHAADKRVHSIREAYLPELSVIPGVNAAIFEELEGRIFTAFSLYDARNVIKNGDFNNGLSCWNVKGHVDVEEQNNHRSVLVVPEWEAEVSQEVRVCPGRGYILRVTAYKEGYGEGCVTIHEIEDNTDELKFSNCVEEEVYPNNTVTCNNYTATQEEHEGTYTSRNRGYDEAYESNSSVHASVYEEKSYTDRRRENPCESNRGYGDYTPLPAGYVTKELEYFPETDKVWIEIGETEGTFIVDSVELLLMEE
uniref:Crystaline entomocidal protoxin n=1 Tax=Bacillus thuringiensis TaxID=1428 RepID=O06894_BACTU|nr:Cry1Ea4 [Bacillus thuringiensis]